MKVLIVEDEDLAVKKLQRALVALDAELEIAGITDSIQATVDWLRTNAEPDLIFMDVELADGQSFEIFNRIEVKSPVIFVTSYDEFALKAFKVNSVDYLLKPIQKEELEAALQKYKKFGFANTATPNMESFLLDLQAKLRPKEYRARFLVKQAQKLISIEVKDIAYFYSDNRINFFKTHDNRRYVVDYLMEELEEMLDPKRFFRVSRALFVSAESIVKIEDFLGGRLVLQLKPALEKEALVSREKVSDFKVWMGK
ncbi:MAG: response regulator transcription factor [Saprospiraceae bacterium]|nr:response regulator transcription factor [Saprospiraceae bacterium]